MDRTNDKISAWYALRRTLPPWSFEENLKELVDHLPVQYGCFCAEHLRRFSERVGENVAREQLVSAILQGGEPHPWRGAFLDLQSEIMIETAAFLSSVVHNSSPA